MKLINCRYIKAAIADNVTFYNLNTVPLFSVFAMWHTRMYMHLGSYLDLFEREKMPSWTISTLIINSSEYLIADSVKPCKRISAPEEKWRRQDRLVNQKLTGSYPNKAVESFGSFPPAMKSTISITIWNL